MERNLRLLLVRHPETEWQDVKDPETHRATARLLGRSDVPLSARGRERAERLAQHFACEPLSRIYASPLLRARETAEGVAAHAGLTPKFDAALREIDFGACEGLAFSDLAIRFPAVHASYLARDLALAFPEGESVQGFRARVETWLRECLAREHEGTVAVVSHGGVIRTLICMLLNWPAEMFWSICQDYGGITAIRLYGNDYVIECMNQTV